MAHASLLQSCKLCTLLDQLGGPQAAQSSTVCSPVATLMHNPATMLTDVLCHLCRPSRWITMDCLVLCRRCICSCLAKQDADCERQAEPRNSLNLYGIAQEQ